MNPNSWNWAGIDDILGRMDGMVTNTDTFLDLMRSNVNSLADESEGDTVMGVDEMNEVTTALQVENQNLVTQLRTTLNGAKENMMGVSTSGYANVTGT